MTNLQLQFWQANSALSGAPRRIRAWSLTIECPQQETKRRLSDPGSPTCRTPKTPKTPKTPLVRGKRMSAAAKLWRCSPNCGPHCCGEIPDSLLLEKATVEERVGRVVSI
eukprot:symbB.v1.2.026868.t1/scaffold2718.1/size72361/6